MVGDGTRFVAKTGTVRLSEEYLARRHTGGQRLADDGRTLVGGATLTAWWSHLALPPQALAALLETGELALDGPHGDRLLAWLDPGRARSAGEDHLGFVHDGALYGLDVLATPAGLRLRTAPARTDRDYRPVVTLTGTAR